MKFMYCLLIDLVFGSLAKSFIILMALFMWNGRYMDIAVLLDDELKQYLKGDKNV